MSSRWETVAAFTTAIAAHAARTKLESEGIECFVADENLVGANPLYSNAIGGVKVQVAPEDAKRAREALGEELEQGVEAGARDGNQHGQAPSEAEAKRFNATDDIVCPKCGKNDVESLLFSGKSSALAWLLGSLLVMVPLPWFKGRHRRCRSCGHQWASRQS